MIGSDGEEIITVLRPKWYRILLGGVETYYEEAFRKKGAGITVISTALARRAAAIGIEDDKICCIPGGTSRIYTKHIRMKNVGTEWVFQIAYLSFVFLAVIRIWTWGWSWLQLQMLRRNTQQLN